MPCVSWIRISEDLSMKKISLILTFLLMCILVSNVSAISFDNCEGGNLTLTYVNSDAGYDDEFGYVVTDSLLPLGIIHHVSIGSTYSMGVYTGGHVQIYIKDPYDNVYKSFQPASDGLVHTHYVIKPDGSWTINFEDLLGGGDLDYDDVILNVACTPRPIPTPEFPIIAVPAALIIGLIGAVIFIQNIKK